MRLKWILSAVLAAALLMDAMQVSAEAPYKGYVYNEWDRAVPSPNGYLPEAQITGRELGIGDFNNPQDLFVDKAINELYIVDSGNNRIVVLDSNYKVKRMYDSFQTRNGTETLNNPTGIYVDRNGKMYIADQDNARVVVADRNGNIADIIGKPVSDIIPEDFTYKPKKIVVDSYGRLYIQALGVFEGMICLNEDGSFINYFGSNRVEVTAGMLIDLFFKRILTQEQKRAMATYVPIEYSNMYIDGEDFIYATVKSSQNSRDEIKKLNALGVNTMRIEKDAVYAKNNYGDHKIVWYRDYSIDSIFVDITVDDDGFISVLDSSRGRVFQYDEEGNLMFALGMLGNQLGTFKIPAALENLNGKLLVLDSQKCSITIFGVTSFGETVRTALKLYNDGKYQEALEPWLEVMNRSMNYPLTYIGLGKAYYQLERYSEAMKYFKLGNDRKGYSDAFKEYLSDFARSNFAYIVLLLFLIIAGMELLLHRKRLYAVYKRYARGWRA